MADLPVRYCHGCRQHDDHPRVHHIPDASDVAADELYHYDCLPEHVDIAPEHHRVALKATDSGLRGDDVRAVMAKHAAHVKEAPADKKGHR